MKRLKALAIAAALATPVAAFAQTYYPERIIVEEHQRYYDHLAREGGAIQSGAGNLPDAVLAHSVAMAIADDPRLDGVAATVSAVDGRVSITGLADHQQNQVAQQVAASVAGPASVSGALSSDLG